MDDQGSGATLMVASEKMAVAERLGEWESKVEILADQDQNQAQALLGQARSLMTAADQDADFLARKQQEVKKVEDGDTIAQRQTELEGGQDQLASVLAQLFEMLDGTVIKLQEEVEQGRVDSPEFTVLEDSSEDADVSSDTNITVQRSVTTPSASPLVIQRAISKDKPPNFLFRGDNNYVKGEPVGNPIAKDDDIDPTEINDQRAEDAIEHVQNSNKNIEREERRYSSFSVAMAINKTNGPVFFARKENIRKVAWDVLLELASKGEIKIYWPDDIAAMIRSHSEKKIRREANAVKSIMERHGEVLIEGQIPAEYILKTN